MSKSHAVINAILFHMYQQEMPNHEFSHQLFLPVDQSDLLWQKNGDNNPANSMLLCYLIMRSFILFFLSYIDLKSAPHSV